MPTNRSQIIEYIEQGNIPPEKIEDALTAAQIYPDGKKWQSFIDQLLYWLGGLALAFSMMLFIAYNWGNIGRFAKFALVEGGLVLAIIAYARCDKQAISGKVSLLVATILIGVLLALYGQTYQTGADPWELFLIWAMLMLPLAIIGRFPAIWMIWVLLLNITIILYYHSMDDMLWVFLGQYTSAMIILWMTFSLNTLSFALWEFASKKQDWLKVQWAPRLLATASAISITLLVSISILTKRVSYEIPLLAWMLWLGALYFFYQKRTTSIFMLASGCLSGIFVVFSFIIKHNEPVFIFTAAIMIIGMGAGAVRWLNKIHQENQS